MDNQYEWASHEPSGLKAGVDPNIIDVIKYNKPAVGLGEKETVIIAFGRELFAQRKVSPATFAVALRFFGPGGTADLASLMSQYAATSALVNAFDMQLPEGRNRLLPAR
jgi:4-carboxymuconolactone decarboxylase